MIGDVLALVLAGAAYFYFFYGDFGHLNALGVERPAGWRRRRYRVWIAKSWLVFGGASVLGLAIMGRLSALVTLPPPFLGLATAAAYPVPLRLIGTEMIGGLAAGAVLGAGLTLWRRRRGRGPAMLGDFSILLPRDRGEAMLAAAAALSAAVCEEVYFRLLLPLAITRSTGSAVAGVAIAALAFGYAHRYQRWAGMIATFAVGLLFAFIYLQTGRLWLAMLVHAGVNLNGLVVRPALAGMLRRDPLIP